MDDKLPTPSNCRVKLTTRSGSHFTGILHSFDENCGKIVLKSVTTAGSKLCGPQNFFLSDLVDVQLLSCEDDISNHKKPATNKRECLDVKTSTSMETELHHLQSLESITSNDHTMENKFGEKVEGGEDRHVAGSNDYYEEDGYILICCICDKFYDAIVCIMEQNVVGVAFKGVNIGQGGTLSLIQIVTESGVFIFDILRIGQQAFDEGLQALFEAKKIVKVIHDCRWISDMLYEKYNVALTNVFDTQVANTFVYKILHNGDWPQYVESLPTCLVKHLNLPLQRLNFKAKGRLTEIDPSVWLQRPLSANLLSAENKNVSHLIQLYQVLINKLLSEFIIGVELYMNYVKMLNGRKESHRMDCHLPSIFLEIPKLVVNTYTNKNTLKDYMKDYQDRQFNISDQQIIFTHDSVWHHSKESKTCEEDYPAKEGRSNCFNDYRKGYINNKNRADGSASNIIVSENSKFYMNKELQNSLSHTDEMTCSANHLSKNSLISRTRETNNSSKIVTINSNQEYRSVEEILESKSKSDLSVPNYSDKSGANCVMELEQANNFQGKLLTVHKSTEVEQRAENVLATEINRTPSVMHASDSSICHSKLWQAVFAKQSYSSSNLSCELSASEKSSNQLDFHSSNSDKSIETKLGEAILQPIDINFPSPVKSSIRNSSFENLEMDASPKTPQLLDTSSSFSTSFTSNYSSSGTESSLTPCVLKVNVHNTRLSNCSLLPAGYKKVDKKKISRCSKEFNETVYLPTLPLEDDLCCIPMEGSLKRVHEHPLGAPFGIGDPFSKTEYNTHQSKSPQSFESHLALDDETAVEDIGVENIDQLRNLQKALKIVSIASSVNLQHKLLPPKTSPDCS